MMKKRISSISLITSAKHLLFLLAVACSTTVVAQKERKNAIGVSAPVVWNSTKIYNSYSGARGKNISGTAFSNGVNITYERTVYKSFFALIGVGYYKQNFDIQRPFDYDDPYTNLLYTTNNYYYQCVQYIGGLGYSYELNKKYKLNAILSYNHFNTFKQVFNPIWGSPNPQIENKKYTFSKSVILKGTLSRNLTKHIGIGADILLPIYNRWRKDLIFREDTNQFYGSEFSIGIGITASYKF